MDGEEGAEGNGKRTQEECKKAQETGERLRTCSEQGRGEEEEKWKGWKKERVWTKTIAPEGRRYCALRGRE
jgi:hypothetical protein